MPTPQRISLIEAYDNRDVIAWLVRHTEEIKDLQDLVDALPESDKFVLTIGDQTINGTKSFVNKITAAGGIEADTLVRINADLQVYGDIYQNGSAYDTHAEQLYSTKDYILMRDGAVTALSPGTMSGLEIIKYDGVNNLRLAVDDSGVARVGDVGDEQPLLTRAEEAALIDGKPLAWNATDKRAVSLLKDLGGVINGSTSISTTGWNTGVSPYTDYPYNKEIGLSGLSGITDPFPIVSLDPSNPEISLFAPVCDCNANGIMVYASAIPTAAMNITFSIVYKVS